MPWIWQRKRLKLKCAKESQHLTGISPDDSLQSVLSQGEQRWREEFCFNPGLGSKGTIALSATMQQSLKQYAKYQRVGDRLSVVAQMKNARRRQKKLPVLGQKRWLISHNAPMGSQREPFFLYTTSMETLRNKGISSPVVIAAISIASENTGFPTTQ